MKIHDSYFMGCSNTSSKKKGYSNISLLQEIRKSSNKQPNFITKGTKIKKTIPNPKLVE